MSTASTSIAAAATIPTFNSDQRILLRSAMLSPMLYKLAHVRILGRLQLRLRSLEDQLAFAQNHEVGSRRKVAPMVSSQLQTSVLRIVTKIRHQVAVLIAVRHDERGSF